MKKQYQLPREFGEKWVKEIRNEKSDFDFFENNVSDLAFKIMGIHPDNHVSDIPKSIINTYLLFDKMSGALYGFQLDNKGWVKSADWIESNVEFI